MVDQLLITEATLSMSAYLQILNHFKGDFCTSGIHMTPVALLDFNFLIKGRHSKPFRYHTTIIASLYFQMLSLFSLHYTQAFCTCCLGHLSTTASGHQNSC